jgi:hypothetical protein
VVPAAATEQTAYVTVSGLPTNTDYCVIWVASNASAGPIRSYAGGFITGGPDATTLAASAISSNAATLNASVNPGGNNTTAYFEYAPAGSLFCATIGDAGFAEDFSGNLPAGAGSSAVPISAIAGGLLPSTSYCYRVYAYNGNATTYADTTTFTTAAAPAGGGGGGGGGTPGGGSGGTPGGTTPAPVTATPVAGPFDTLAVALTQYDLKLAKLRFAAVLGKAGSKVSAKATYKKKVVASLTKTAGPGTISFTLKINKTGKKLLKKIKKGKIAKIALQVTVTPPGGAAITKKSTISLKRAKDPCVITKASAGGLAHAAC